MALGFLTNHISMPPTKGNFWERSSPTALNPTKASTLDPKPKNLEPHKPGHNASGRRPLRCLAFSGASGSRASGLTLQGLVRVWDFGFGV